MFVLYIFRMTGLFPMTDELFYRHFTLAQQENRIYADWCKKRGVSYVWIVILDTILRAEEAVEPALLSDSLFIPRQTMTNLLDQLEKSGLIRRVPHATDRRRVQLLLTEKGNDTITRILRELAVHENAIVGEITRDEMATFNRIYSRLVDQLRERLTPDHSEKEG